MGKCNLDHSLEDVLKKFETQKDFLPSNIREGFLARLGSSRNQETLNEIFHLLKKYDLATEEERAARDSELERILLEKE
ncbi:group-specific protein [Neobacillus notoginsengisoli]|uniref:Group-specific protein n=1 Tax=Neobacillus notoginsengisoli TaxID=1578198 RepID=A0A417YWZ1_9BACI|nr:group-specific protein [Neobacillus notoginsengisoli]RHW42081.1 group-specific protein [Neobacillus notoginsengisoli]